MTIFDSFDEVDCQLDIRLRLYETYTSWLFMTLDERLDVA